MIRKLSKNLVPLTAIVASTLLGSGLANAASMASDASQTSVSAASNAPVAVTMQQLDERVAKVPALASLKSGDQVSISDDGSVTGLVWQGTYTFYPAGSVVPVAPTPSCSSRAASRSWSLAIPVRRPPTLQWAVSPCPFPLVTGNRNRRERIANDKTGGAGSPVPAPPVV